ncbi:MAG: hypothetical protein ACKO6N_12100 [Myxococcota bacterium]
MSVLESAASGDTALLEAMPKAELGSLPSEERLPGSSSGLEERLPGSSSGVEVPARARDLHGKRVLRLLAGPREIETEVEHTPSFRTDMLIRPGPPLPLESGLLGVLVRERMTLVELFSARPTQVALWHARAKGFLSLEKLPLPWPRAPILPMLQLVVTVGTPRRALARAFGVGAWIEVEPGVRRHYHVYEVVHIDLLRLPLRLDTAWLHVMGGRPFLKEALGLLLQHGRSMDLLWINTLFSESRSMETLQSSYISPEMLSESARITLAFEQALSNHESYLKGQKVGLLEGIEKGIERGIEKGIEWGRAEGIEKGIEKGIERGRAEGIEKGIEKGIERGRAEGEVRAARDHLLLTVELRFKRIPATLPSVLERLSRPEQLRALIPTALLGSLDELTQQAQTLVECNIT